MAQDWKRFLNPRDREVLQALGFGARMGFGERPALLIIDTNYEFIGERPLPILESIKHWRGSCGEEGWAAVAVMKRLIDTAHDKGVPVIYSTNTRRADRWDAGSWRWKSAGERAPGPRDARVDEIVAEIAPLSQDILIRKTKPSVFFGTPLLSYLTLLKVDSLIVCGGTTSGCVRASVLDAFSENIRCAVVAEGCFDRVEVSHAMNLVDMQAKYADVIDAEEARSYLASLQSGLFALPGAEK
ncbi:MAG: isochorismatase family protein [Burkholderiales bacterium]